MIEILLALVSEGVLFVIRVIHKPSLLVFYALIHTIKATALPVLYPREKWQLRNDKYYQMIFSYDKESGRLGFINSFQLISDLLPVQRLNFMPCNFMCSEMTCAEYTG